MMSFFWNDTYVVIPSSSGLSKYNMIGKCFIYNNRPIIENLAQ